MNHWGRVIPLEFVREPLLIRGETPADEIIPALRHARQAMALVVDDGAEVVGLVTAEDVLRQIVAQQPRDSGIVSSNQRRLR